jgi:hypothetical protein
MPAVACLADLDQDHLSVGNIGVEVFAAGVVVVVVVVVVAAAAVAVEVAAVDVAVAAVDPHHYVIEAETVVVAVGPEEVDSGCQENVVVVVESVAAARDPLLLVRVVVLAQDQVVLTVVEHRVTELVTSLYPVVVGPCLVVIHWPPQIQVHLLRHQDHHMDVGDSQMTILAGDIPHLVVPQGPTVQAALEAYPFRLYIIRMVPPYL